MKLVKILDESDRIADFEKKADKTFFATISGFVDESLFYNDRGEYDDQGQMLYREWNESGNRRLLGYLNQLGFDYQKVSGVWDGSIEKSYLVWNTQYTWEQFQQIMLKLNEIFKQWGICIGRKVGNKYEIALWQTDSLEDIRYKIVRKYTTVAVKDALKDSGTILTRKIRDRNGNISPYKTNRAIKFEAICRNRNAASGTCYINNYIRKNLIEKLMTYGDKFLEHI